MSLSEKIQRRNFPVQKGRRANPSTRHAIDETCDGFATYVWCCEDPVLPLSEGSVRFGPRFQPRRRGQVMLEVGRARAAGRSCDTACLGHIVAIEEKPQGGTAVVFCLLS